MFEESLAFGTCLVIQSSHSRLNADNEMAQWTQAWEHWICWARLGQPVRNELSAMIFSKSLRRKDVKGAGRAIAKISEELGLPETPVVTNDPGDEGQTDPLLDTEAPPAPKAGATDGGDEDFLKSRQSTINLVVSAAIICRARNITYPRFECRALMPNGFPTFPSTTLRSRNQLLNWLLLLHFWSI